LTSNQILLSGRYHLKSVYSMKGLCLCLCKVCHRSQHRIDRVYTSDVNRLCLVVVWNTDFVFHNVILYTWIEKDKLLIIGTQDRDKDLYIYC
jgi:hypothetical protein